MEVLAEVFRHNKIVILEELRELRELDRISHSEMEAIRAEEAQLVTELQSVIKEGKTVVEEEILAKQKALTERRSVCTQRYDQQMSIAQRLYDQLDGQINYLNESTKGMSSLFSNNESFNSSSSSKKKKKRKASAEDEEAEALERELLLSQQLGGDESAVGDMLLLLSADPNEPVYCTCRRVSYGQMIACEDEDCDVEWFHFQCVGLQAEPQDPWFCSMCIAKRSG